MKKRKTVVGKLGFAAVLAVFAVSAAGLFLNVGELGIGNAKTSESYFAGIESMSETSESDSSGWALKLVNSQNPLPRDFEVKLVSLNGGYKVDERIFLPLKEMFESAAEDGIYLKINSAYRSYDEQAEILDEKINEYKNKGYSDEEAEEEALEYVLLPGESEHETGLALDISSAGDYEDKQQAYSWLFNNAYKFGFILRYPSNKQEITGIEYEPWHYRYVGKKAADEMFESGECLEEYLS